MASTKADPRVATPGETPPTDRAGRVETHGIDFIPDSERHGRARDLFAVWAAPNVSYLALVVGGALILMGLSFWQALAVIVVGNLFSILTGIVAASGPASGTPSEVITRAIFGIRGNRVNILVTSWFISVCYLALNWAAASYTAFRLVERFGIEATTPVKVVIILAIAAVTLAIGVYGHATIVRLYQPLALVLTLIFVVMAGYVLGNADWGYQPAEALHGIGLWATVAAGVSIVASAPLSYTNSADFARYLPATTSPVSVAVWTALGAFVPSVLFTALGALAGTGLDMADPQIALETILPALFTPIFLLAVIVGTIANNAMTAYSSGLALQSVGLRLRRSRSVLLDGSMGVAMTLYALLVSNFLDTVSNMMQLVVTVMGPVMAVYVADVLWRRNRYDGIELGNETSSSPYWYSGGINWAGTAAVFTGIAAAALCVAAPVYTGPIANAVGGVDLSLPVGLIVSASLYVVLMRSYRTR
ncbi:purine-cytosine permease family protein [Rhodococcus opacus]|uniref:purine-cytosine permease family protein n=1 Tax=Rhodococcus opacus TaxID=37919 RepID=UPI001B30BA38|nr:cytosine permease [Rhodococcus opacus]